MKSLLDTALFVGQVQYSIITITTLLCLSLALSRQEQQVALFLWRILVSQYVARHQDL